MPIGDKDPLAHFRNTIQRRHPRACRAQRTGPKAVAHDVAQDDGFAQAITGLARDRTRLREMREAARVSALGCSWDGVFSRVYAAYEPALAARAERSVLYRRSSPI